MMTRRSLLLCLGAAPLLAQEGHPLSGTWHGSWTPAGAATPVDITLIMNWDGKTVSGTINPGFDGMKLVNTRLDTGFAVHIEADSKDGRIVADGKIENVTNVRRSIVGTWTQGSRKGEFKVVRDN